MAVTIKRDRKYNSQSHQHEVNSTLVFMLLGILYYYYYYYYYYY